MPRSSRLLCRDPPCTCRCSALAGLSRWRSAETASDALACASSGNSILHSAADSVTSAVQKASQALNERGERLGRAEEKTEDMKNSAQQFAETAHKVGPAEGQRSASGCSGSFTPGDLLQCVSHGGRYKIKIKPFYTPSPIQPAALISTRIVKGFFLYLFLHFSPFQHLYLCL